MCDLSDEQSVNMVPHWIQQIEERSTVHERIIMVLANKCDLAGTESLMVELERELEERFSRVIYREISVLCDVELKTSMCEIAE